MVFQIIDKANFEDHGNSKYIQRTTTFSIPSDPENTILYLSKSFAFEEALLLKVQGELSSAILKIQRTSSLTRSTVSQLKAAQPGIGYDNDFILQGVQ